MKLLPKPCPIQWTCLELIVAFRMKFPRVFPVKMALAEASLSNSLAPSAQSTKIKFLSSYYFSIKILYQYDHNERKSKNKHY
jgi:hypothetical protein